MYQIADLPARVKVGPFMLKVVVSEELWDEPDEGEDEKVWLYGQFCGREQELRFRSAYHCAGQAIDTVIHELLHAIWWVQHLTSELEEEPVVTSIATGLTSLLMDNPALQEWLQVATQEARHQ